MYVVASCNFDPVIQDAEVKATFLWLNLFPGNRNQNRVDVHAGELGDDDICLRFSAGGGVSQLAPENEISLAIHDKLPGSVLHLDVRQIGGMESGGEKTNSNGKKNAAQGDFHESSEQGLSQQKFQEARQRCPVR